MALQPKYPSVLSYLFHPIVMCIGVVTIGVYFGIQQRNTVDIMKQFPTLVEAEIFCERPTNGGNTATCIDHFIALDQFISVLRDEIAPDSLTDCFTDQHRGNPKAVWRCLRSINGKAIHDLYKSPLNTLGSLTAN